MQKELITKLYYSIGEVADIFDIAPSMIRYWESEFPSLKPAKNSKGDRRYKQKDIDEIKIIFHLVKERCFTIEGAKMELAAMKKHNKDDNKLLKSLSHIKTKLESLRDTL